MKIKLFNVVELKDGNSATILRVNKNKYYAEIVNPYGITIDKRYISKNEINKVIYKKAK